ncbi:hypothetical protein E2C01_072018 [Portunus trituberculatus]|uniref:Uncharacterized protein n=1 Tax=Portunus trituberculatus TaxID=210409 RepID=A0A5B7HWW4_PORTR|nr:hypothetical protein [Portunus trituberculatus]
MYSDAPPESRLPIDSVLTVSLLSLLHSINHSVNTL